MAIKAKKSLEESSKEIDRRIEALFSSPKTTKKPDVIDEALKAARHELTTLHGLIAFDAALVSHDKQAIRIDTSETVALIDKALGESGNGE